MAALVLPPLSSERMCSFVCFFCLVDFWDRSDLGYWLYIVSLLSSWAGLVTSCTRGFSSEGSDSRSLVCSLF